MQQPDGLAAQRLDAAKELQQTILDQLKDSGQSAEVQLAICFNVLLNHVNLTWPPGVPRGVVINKMTDEFRGRLQKYLPRQ